MIYARSLKDIYMEHVGQSEVPKLFHEFCCYSLVAACVGDRIGYRYRPEALTIPAIYVFLVGPSGYGKNESIAEARKFASTLESVSHYEGRISGPALMKEISVVQAKCTGDDPVPKLWLVSPELAFTLGSGPKAMDTIKIVTELFSMGGKNLTVKDSTLTYGQSTITRPCLNWLAGTTVKWLKSTVSHDDIEAGFGSRVFMMYVEPDYAQGTRFVRPIIPENYWELRDEIMARLQVLTALRGEFKMTVGAAQVEEAWYMHRPAPVGDLMAAWWQRERELSLKMAMILSLCERDDLVITDAHMAEAQSVVGRAGRSLELLITTAGLVEDKTGLDVILRTIKSEGVISHQKLLKRAMREGIIAYKLQEVMKTLTEAGYIQAMNKAGQVLANQPKGYFYQWVATHGSMPTDFDMDLDDDAMDS